MEMEANDTAKAGSDSWVGAGRYEEGGELHKRAMVFLADTQWEALTSLASELHDGVPCRMSEKNSIGHFNMVRRLMFDDGTNWVVRLRMPELECVFGARECLDARRIMQIEVSTMKFLRYTVRSS